MNQSGDLVVVLVIPQDLKEQICGMIKEQEKQSCDSYRDRKEAPWPYDKGQYDRDP